MSNDTPAKTDANPCEYLPIRSRRMGVGNINNEPPRITRDPVSGEVGCEPSPE